MGEGQGVAPSAPAIAPPVEPAGPEPESVKCVLCHEDFKLTDAGLLRMPNCAHTWHQQCIARYMEVTGKPLEAACPMRCNPGAPDDVFELGDSD